MSVTSILPLLIFIALVSLFVYLFKKSREQGSQVTKLIIYFICSSMVFPLYEVSRVHGKFMLLFPVGFTLILIYLLSSREKNKQKYMASMAGFVVAVIYMLNAYHVW